MPVRGQDQNAEPADANRPQRAPEGPQAAAVAHNANYGTNYGTLHQHNINYNAAIYQEPVDIATRLNPILDASHTRNPRNSPPNSECLKGTRVEFIEKVLSWARAAFHNASEDRAHILWIYGYAGCGKSAISLAVSRKLADEGLLAASFFFFRGAGDRSKAARLLNTIVCQMVAAVPVTYTLVDDTLKRCPWLLSSRSADLSAQFMELVFKPIIAVEGSLTSVPLTIVLDGVDECEDYDEVGRFIESVTDCFNKHPLAPLRFIIASRVEDHLHRLLHSSNQVQLLDLVGHTSNADIKVALESRLRSERSGGVLRYDRSWPSEEDKCRLIEHIGQSFIFMTTLLSELFKPFARDGLTPMDRLPLLLSMKPNFDDLYRSILEPLKDTPHLLSVLGTMALAQEELSIAQIADLLEIRATTVAGVLLNLHSVMRIPSDDRSPAIPWHTSFRDFLQTADRAGPFFISPAHHWRIVCRSVRILASSAGTPSPASRYAEGFCMKHLHFCLEAPEYSMSSGDMSLDQVIPDLAKATGPFGRTALEIACTCRQPNWELVCALVNEGVDVNAKFTNYGALFMGSFRTALHAACYHNAKEVIDILLDNGADPNICSTQTVDHPAFHRHRADAGFEEEAAESWANAAFPLAWAALHGDVDLVQTLLVHGANPNSIARENRFDSPAMSALHHASAGAGDAWREIVRILLEHGADPNSLDRYGLTPLHRACASGGLESVQLLLDFGADPNIRTTLPSTRKILHGGGVPLYEWSSPLPSVSAHALQSSSPYTAGSRGDTPLHYAYFYGRPEVAGFLLSRNADPSVRNDAGLTPLKIARRRGEDGELHPCNDTSSGVRF